MSGLAFLLIAVALSVIGTLVLWMRNRGSTSLDHGVEEFRREMRALSPESRPDEQRRRES